ncbi:MAG: hypothetical protein ACJA1T_000633 [Zhongshania aliphaticivorans]|jgi:hypothetical protein
MAFLLSLISLIGFFRWKKRVLSAEKPPMAPYASRLRVLLWALPVSLCGLLLFMNGANLLSGLGPGASREHFVGVMMILFGPILGFFGIGVFIASCVSIKGVEQWAANQQKDIQLW